MLLILKEMYNKIYFPKREIIIGQFDDSLFTASYYCFRLGAIVDDIGISPIKEPVSLRRHDFLRIFSLETFALSSRMFALLGPCTDLLFMGLKLHNSLTIDPGFSGSLEMLLENYTDKSVLVKPGMKIGKVVFFDVGDSLIGLHEQIQLDPIKATWKARREAGQIITDWIEKNIDAELPKKSRP